MDNFLNIETLYNKSNDLIKLLNVLNDEKSDKSDKSLPTIDDISKDINNLNTLYKRAVIIMNNIENNICICKVKLAKKSTQYTSHTSYTSYFPLLYNCNASAADKERLYTRISSITPLMLSLTWASFPIHRSFV